MEEEAKKPKNFLYTRGYVVSRLISFGFTVSKLKLEFSEKDKRYWSLVINRKGGWRSNVILTCLKESLQTKRGMFIAETSKATLVRIDTISAEVLAETLAGLTEEDQK